jgi:hypothetical protein
MFREFHILLDSPPNNIFTYEDTVSGKVVLESPRDEAVGWIHVFFHGWVNTEVILQNYNSQTSGGPSQSKYKDKEVLFQCYQNVYRGQENLPKKTRHEWPFQFAFETESCHGSSLPSSGKYHKSSVEYKVIAVQGRIGQSEEHIMSMMNPDDPLFMKDAPFSPTGVFLWAGKHIGATAEEKLEFIQVRPTGIVDSSLSPPLFGKHEISSSHLPEIQLNLAAPPEKHGLFHSQHHEHIPFLVSLQVAKSFIEESSFPVLLSVSSATIVWNHKPPPVTLVAFKMHLLAKTIERAGHEASEQSHKQLMFESKDLQIPLGQAPVDIAQLIPLILAGNDIIPSFNTRLLQRKYDVSAEATIEVGGKTFHTPFLLEDSITVLSNLAASARPRAPLPALMQKPAALREEPTTLKLKYGHIGRLTQDGSGPLRADSIIEAAVTLSKLLTIAAVQHSFPGGSLVKLHAYKPDSRHVNNTNWDQVTDREKLVQILTQTGQFRVLPSQNVTDLKLGFSDALHGENISLDFPRNTPFPFFFICNVIVSF